MSGRHFALLLPVIIACQSQGDVLATREALIEQWGDHSSALLDENELLVQRYDRDFTQIRMSPERLELLASYDAVGIQRVQIPEGEDFWGVWAALEASGEYSMIEPPIERSLPEYRSLQVPLRQPTANSFNDPFLSYQVNMVNIQADSFQANADGSGVVVAVIDTGVTAIGNDTPVNLGPGFDFINNDSDATDDEGHGTHVAGTIAQATNNGEGVIGVAPQATIMPIKSLDQNGNGTTNDIVAGINYAVSNGADVINLSLASSGASILEQNAINAALDAGIVVVAASGNNGIQTNGVAYPAAYPGVIAVSSTDFAGDLALYSNAGPELTFAAPGGELGIDSNGNGQIEQNEYEDLNGDGLPDGILQETISNGALNYYFFEGTSMATPHVAAAYAILLEAGATPSQATDSLIATVDDKGTAGFDALYGYGEIRVQSALDHYEASLTSTAVSDLSAGDLLITEVMHDPSQVADYRGEWFEIYNNSAGAVDLNGLVVQSNGESGFTVGTSVELAAGSYFTFASRSNSAVNGGFSPDRAYTYGNIKLYSNDGLTLSNGSSTLDSVTWDSSSFPVVGGATLSLGSLDATLNDTGAYWCSASSSFGDGDLGTPGSANDSCADVPVPLSSISAGDLVITEIMHDPAAVADYRGEWFELYNSTSDAIDLNGLQLGSGESGTAISSATIIEAEDYLVLGNRSNSAVNGGISDVVQYNGAGFVLYANDSITISSASGTALDTVTYSTAAGFPQGQGASLMSTSLSASGNNASSSWCESSAVYGAGDYGTPGAPNGSCETRVDQLSAGDLIITEVMVDPAAVVDNRGEWFELYNSTATAINLNGLVVGSNGESGFTVSSDVTVAAGDYALLGVRDDSALNGGVTLDYRYAYGEVKLYINDTLSVSAGGTTIDAVSFSSSSYPSSTGRSLTLGSIDADDNDQSTYWCSATSSYGAGDLGTPGSSNDTCTGLPVGLSSLSAGDLVISEVMVDPAQVSDYRGEWFEVYNRSNSAVNLSGLQVSSQGESGFTVSSTVVIPAAGYAVLGVRDNTAINGGVTVDYRYIYGEVKLYINDQLSIAFSGTTFDSVSLNSSSYPSATGRSLFTGALDATLNDSSGQWCASVSSYGDGDLGTPGSANDACTGVQTLSQLSAGDLVITEVMHNPDEVSDHRGEWFELYNASGSDVDLNGLVVGSSSDSGFTLSGELVVGAGELALFAVRSNSAVNGGISNVDAVYSINEIKFTDVDSLSVGSSSTTLDSVAWGSIYPIEAGRSLNLDAGSLNASSNDSVASWCAATSSFGDGDRGTPGAGNSSCP